MQRRPLTASVRNIYFQFWNDLVFQKVQSIAFKHYNDLCDVLLSGLLKKSISNLQLLQKSVHLWRGPEEHITTALKSLHCRSIKSIFVFSCMGVCIYVYVYRWACVYISTYIYVCVWINAFSSSLIHLRNKGL